MKVYVRYVKATYALDTFHSGPYSISIQWKSFLTNQLIAIGTSSDDNCLQHNIDLFDIKLGR